MSVSRETDARFCVACRWHRADPPYGDGLCFATVYDLVSGEVLDAQAGLSCRLLRQADMPCGIDGRLWEAKE